MTVIHHWLVDTCSLIWKKNECSPLIFEYPMQATCWRSDEFRYILQPVSCSPPIFQIKKHICTFYIDIHSLKYFQSIYRSCCKVRMWFVTCKLGDCRVWTLTTVMWPLPGHSSLNCRLHTSLFVGAHKILHASRRKHILILSVSFTLEGCFWVVLKCLDPFALNWSWHP